MTTLTDYTPVDAMDAYWHGKGAEAMLRDRVQLDDSMPRKITYLDLTTGTMRTGQYWSDAPLVTGRHAVWVVTDGHAVHVHKPDKRHRDTQRAPARPHRDSGIRDRCPGPCRMVGRCRHRPP